MRDPARSLYSTAAYYLSVMTVNAAVTIINAAILLLLTYGMVGECCFMFHPREPYKSAAAAWQLICLKCQEVTIQVAVHIINAAFLLLLTHGMVDECLLHMPQDIL